MTTDNVQYTPPARKTAWYSFLAMLPFAVPLILFFTNLNTILMSLEYAGMVIIFGIPIVLLGIHFSIELTIRVKKLKGYRKFPWFTLVAMLGLAAFFFVGEVVKPLVMLNPSFGRCLQNVEWTSKSNRYFVLCLIGSGNKTNYQFDAAYMNWGESPYTPERRFSGSISVMRFRPTRFGVYYQDEKDMPVATPEILRKRISTSGLTGDELDSMTTSIWEVMQQVSDGVPVTSTNGHVTSLSVEPHENLQHVFGGWLLIIVLFVVYQFVGQWTLRQPMQLDSTHLV